MQNTLEAYQNNPIKNKINLSLNQCERIEEIKINRLHKLNLQKIKKEFNHKRNVILLKDMIVLF